MRIRKRINQIKIKSEEISSLFYLDFSDNKNRDNAFIGNDTLTIFCQKAAEKIAAVGVSVFLP